MSEKKTGVAQAPGKTLIQVSSIYYIMMGALATFSAIMMFNSRFGNTLAFFWLFDAAAFLLIGILGVRHRGSLAHAKRLRNLGVLAIIWELFSPVTVSGNVVQIFNFSVDINAATLALYFMPIIYFIGARQNVVAADPVYYGFRALEKGKWGKADRLFQQGLDTNPEDAKAYIGKLCVELRSNRAEALLNHGATLHNYESYQKALQFAGENDRATWERYALTPEAQL